MKPLAGLLAAAAIAAVCRLRRCRHRHRIPRRNAMGLMGLECLRCGDWRLHPGWAYRLPERQAKAVQMDQALARIEQAERRERAKLSVMRKFGR